MATAGQLSTLFAQGTAFTYQGRLLQNGVPANGAYDCVFRCYDVPTGGLGLTFANLRRITASNGLFTTTLDFGSAVFTGGARWLEIDIGTNSVETTLIPRQPLTPAPYAIFAAHTALTNGAVDTPQLAPGAVTANKIAVETFNTTFWRTGGNSNTAAGTHFIGTTDDRAFEIRVNNARVMRYRPGTFDPDEPTLIGGSLLNFVAADVSGATIAGGGGSFFDEPRPNRVTVDHGTVGGGWDNASSGVAATVSGGEGNTAGHLYATVSGGKGNTANDPYATVSGGYTNTASGTYSTVSGGIANAARGWASTVTGGSENSATADYSFAAGRRAKADDPGSFVWADSSGFDFRSGAADQFAVRCTGGARFVTAINASGGQTAGVRLGPGDTSWSMISDRAAKKNFHPVDARAVLDKLASVPVESWNYQWESDDAVPHLGPMAQDFKAAFYPGRDDKSISTLEFDGVALAAIQGLNQKLEEQRAELKQKQTEVTELKARLARLEELVTNSNPKGN